MKRSVLGVPNKTGGVADTAKHRATAGNEKKEIAYPMIATGEGPEGAGTRGGKMSC